MYTFFVAPGSWQSQLEIKKNELSRAALQVKLHSGMLLLIGVYISIKLLQVYVQAYADMPTLYLDVCCCQITRDGRFKPYLLHVRGTPQKRISKSYYQALFKSLHYRSLLRLYTLPEEVNIPVNPNLYQTIQRCTRYFRSGQQHFLSIKK